jgi:hypothetical protein
MVKELHVEDPHEKEVAWEDKVDAYYEMAFEGLPLPEKLQELHLEQFGHYTGERDPAAVRAEKQWDAYMLWAGDISQDSRSPRERLSAYFDEQQ